MQITFDSCGVCISIGSHAMNVHVLMINAYDTIAISRAMMLMRQAKKK